MTELDAITELVLKKPDFFRNGENLPPEKRAVISLEDTWEISLINALSPEDLVRIGNCFEPMDSTHYYHFQGNVWFEAQRVFLANRLGREPDSLEIISDARENRNFETFRLCYILNFPYKTRLNFDNYADFRELADGFLADAQLLHRFRYPYFAEISTNSLMIQPPSEEEEKRRREET